MQWLLRMVTWARNPPSAARVWLVLGVVAACLAIWGIEQLVGFPEDWAPARAPVQLR
ncbi:hypothetical protein [Pseudooceanicola nanhaiensis]|uniref:hypothetical protein n=1 Tax=Pseudooceanicola TaxID=1679449 RepID=UPI00146FA636|nr:hypothetical protein [Pseudooceanicola nanhaiensis]